MEDVYALCTAQPQSYSSKLYEALKEHLQNHVEKLREGLQDNMDITLLSNYFNHWRNYSVGGSFLNAIFSYLNTRYIQKQNSDNRGKVTPGTTELYEVNNLVLVTWKERLFEKLKDRLLSVLLNCIKADRDGEQVNQTLVSGVIQSYVALGAVTPSKQLELYTNEFETHFLQATKDFYARESSSYIATHGISAFMLKAEIRLEEESVRGKKFVNLSTVPKLIKECENVLIDAHKEKMQEECEQMLQEDRQTDLTRMFHLLNRTENIKPMLDTLEKYVTSYGLEQIKSIPEAALKEPTQYIETLLAVYLKFSGLVKTAFKGSPQFVVTVDKACRKIVNENPVNKKNSNKSPEMLAKYCDNLLKKGPGQKNMEEQELEQKITNVIYVFKYIDDKDVFQKFYSKMLAKRLIQNSSVSSDSERAMITQLKQACGIEYTSKLQRMFNDVTLSKEFQDNFHQYVSNAKMDLGKVDFSIMVLTAGSWPLQAQTNAFMVPQELEKCVNAFQTYYSGKQAGRKLQWLHHLSKGEIKMMYTPKKYEVGVTTYQMGLLLLFNDNESMTIEAVSKATNLKDSELHRIVQSLVSSKLLLKSPEDEQVKDSDVLTLNKKFTSKRMKFKVSAPLQQETAKEVDGINTSIQEDRKLYLQAAIVRIMKARKTLDHNNLLKEVIAQSSSRFQPNVPMIKKCIEQLIEKEYLKRESANQYSYVA